MDDYGRGVCESAWPVGHTCLSPCPGPTLSVKTVEILDEGGKEDTWGGRWWEELLGRQAERAGGRTGLRDAEEGGVCPRRESGPCRGDPESERRKQTCPKARYGWAAGHSGVVLLSTGGRSCCLVGASLSAHAVRLWSHLASACRAAAQVAALWLVPMCVCTWVCEKHILTASDPSQDQRPQDAIQHVHYQPRGQ